MGEAESPFEGSSEAKSLPEGSREMEPVSSGSDSTGFTPSRDLTE